MSTNIFEQAARLKLRFDTSRGSLSAEDLWDLPLSSDHRVNLNTIAVDLHHALEHEEISFVEDVPAVDQEQRLRFDVVKHIIDVRRAENKAALEAKTKADQKQKILALIARKEDEKLDSLDADQLRAMLATV